jgi:hypothetical protein
VKHYGGTEPVDFLLMAIDGYQLRLDGMQEQLHALRRTVEAMARRTSTRVRGGEPEAATPRKKIEWTPAQRAAAAKRMRERIAAGFVPGKGYPKGKRPAKKARAKHSPTKASGE